MLAPPVLREVHPLGKSPVIEDSDSGGKGEHVIAETGAIIEYLVEKADGRLGAPSAGEESLRYRHFLQKAR